MKRSSWKVLSACLSLLCVGGEALAGTGWLDASEETMMAQADACYSQLPLTAELSLKTSNKGGYNIFIANQSKASPWHWEVFSQPGSGTLSAYLPGFTPDHLHSQVDVVDDAWHRVSLTLSQEKLVLSLDGKVVASVRPESTPVGKSALPGEGLYLGQLQDGGLRCDGLIDEVRILNAQDVVASWNFETVSEKGSPDGSGAKRDLKSCSFSYTPLPALEDPAPWRVQAQECVAKLKLKTPGLGAERDQVYSFWKFNFDNHGKIDYVDSRRAQWYATDEKAQARVASQAYDAQANPQPGDRGATGSVLRRTQALLERLATLEGVDKAQLAVLEEDWGKLNQAWSQMEKVPTEADGLYFACCALRRQAMFLNPLLNFDEFLSVSRGSYQGSVRSQPSTSDGAGGHFATQYFGYTTLPGGGLYRISHWKTQPRIENILEHSVVQKGSMAGKKLNGGAFCAPDLSFDGKRIVFAWSGNRSHKINAFTEDRVWHIFCVDTDGNNLVQLTEGKTDDFDPCWMPDGRIVFVSERRGGYIRCFDKYIQVPNYTLFSMKEDGSDIVPVSYFETSEWNPSVNNDGMLVYTRWDYTDRENCIGGRFWICGPDGTNPRAPHGNYPDPYHSYPGHWDEFTQKYPDIPFTGIGSRLGTPLVEMGIRAIPGSHLYVMTAAPHHGQLNGSLAILDLRMKDDNYMSQVRRLTPDELFPETEFPARAHYKYGTPWPLSEDFFLSNCWEDIIVLDRFGNQELLCGIREVNPAIDERFRMLDPIPLMARPQPPILPSRVYQGERASADAPKATISVMNVYETDLPLPEGTKIKYLRVVQNILKENHAMGEPMVGYERENTPRIPLGIVPVEEDGSVYFEAPVAKELIYQLLDEDQVAVHSMRSVSFVFPGEQLSCIGCHEQPDRSPAYHTVPLAMRKAPAKLQPEMNSIEPISYYRQIKPIFEKTCLPCHQKTGKGLQDMSYEALKEDTAWFSGGMFSNTVGSYVGTHGGSRTIPGKFGARYCQIGKALLSEKHKQRVSEEERKAVLLWLDCNSLRLGSFMREEDQLKGELVWPILDVDPDNVQGIEGREPGLKKNFWHENE